jgi:hypothetical protein
MLNILFRSITVCGVALVSLILVSCSGHQRGSSTADDISPISCLVVMPTTTPYTDKVDSLSIANEEDLQEGAAFVDGVVLEELRGSKVVDIIETAQLRLELEGIEGGKRGALQEISRESQCNFVLMTVLTDYQQRQGGEYAVDAPASAAFEMRLFDAATGTGLWMATFNETQTSLLSNLFSFNKAQKRGFKWITVEELITQGISEKLQECPYLK